MRGIFVASGVIVALVACGGAQPSSQSAPYGPPRPAVVNGVGCGVAVFAATACEAVVDQTCCKPQTDCAGDAACDTFMRCRYACKHRGDRCLDACMNDIVQRHGAPAMRAVMREFDAIATCSKSVFTQQGDPPGARCNDDG